MTKDFQASKPIYIQIADHIAYQIVRGEIGIGDKLPSVREMAIQLGVNPNTIQRTYSELEGMGIVGTKRGQGTFVREEEEIIEDLKTRLQKEVISDFVKNMQDLGFTREEMEKGVQDFLRGREDGD